MFKSRPPRSIHGRMDILDTPPSPFFCSPSLALDLEAPWWVQPGGSGLIPPRAAVPAPWLLCGPRQQDSGSQWLPDGRAEGLPSDLGEVGSGAMARLSRPQHLQLPQVPGLLPRCQSLSDSHRLVQFRNAAPITLWTGERCPLECARSRLPSALLFHSGRWNTVGGGVVGKGKQLSLHWSCGHPSAIGEAPLICSQDLPRRHISSPGSKGPCSICRMGAPSVEWSPLLQPPPQPQNPCSWDLGRFKGDMGIWGHGINGQLLVGM